MRVIIRTLQHNSHHHKPKNTIQYNSFPLFLDPQKYRTIGLGYPCRSLLIFSLPHHHNTHNANLYSTVTYHVTPHYTTHLLLCYIYNTIGLYLSFSLPDRPPYQLYHHNSPVKDKKKLIKGCEIYICLI